MAPSCNQEAASVPKGPCGNVLVPSHQHYWEVVEPLKGRAYGRTSGHWGQALRGNAGAPAPPLPLFHSHKVSSPPPCASAMICHLGTDPKAMVPVTVDWNLQKCEAKGTFCLYKLTVSGAYCSNRKLTNTFYKRMPSLVSQSGASNGLSAGDWVSGPKTTVTGGSRDGKSRQACLPVPCPPMVPVSLFFSPPCVSFLYSA
jgi:hypothetical protein